MSKISFKPTRNRVLIKPQEFRQTESGIVIPDTVAEKPGMGEVIIGNSDVKKGDKVLFSKYGYDEVEIDNESYYLVSDFSILGVL